MLNNIGSPAIHRRWICPRRSAVGTFRPLNTGRGHESYTNRRVWIPPPGRPPRLVLPPLPKFLDGGAELVGSSHGWVALFNKRNNDLFLSDPLSHRHIKLPPVHTLPDPEFNLDVDGHASVSKVILWSSPEDDDCRAMMTFGPGNRLAFCSPGRSSEWTPIGDEHFLDHDHHDPFDMIARVHEDLVYCSRRKVFTSMTAAHLDLRDVIGFRMYDTLNTSKRCDWDIEDPNSPKLVKSEDLYVDDEYENSWLDRNIEVLEEECIQIPHLVYAEQSDQLFVAMRFVRLMKEDGESPLGSVPTCQLKGLKGVFPGKTFGFLVMEMVEEKEKGGCCLRVVEDLNGMSMFVGINHSFAISISGDENEKFKPNAIYFTDAKRIERVCGVNDCGVFDYETKTISARFRFVNGGARLLISSFI